jgi:hypothetical protein
MRTARERCERAFAFLEFDYGCRRHGRYIDHSGFELYYWNKTTGVRALCTLRDPLLIWICRLLKEGFPPRAGGYYARSRIRWYDIEDIKAVITGREPADPYNLQLSFEELAEDFRAHAEPLLRGDFALLGSVESHVAARRKDVEDQR